MDSHAATYKRLITFHIDRLHTKGASNGTIRNAESALQRFMRVARRSMSSSIQAEMWDDTQFNALLDRCVKDRPGSSKRAYQSLLRRWRESAFDLLLESTKEDKDFHDTLLDALTKYQTKHKISEYKLAKLCSIHTTTLRRFMRGTSSITESAIHIPLHDLETLLELPKGTLVRAKERYAVPHKEPAAISYREKQIELVKSQYRFPTPPPLYQIHEEFLALRSFKTAEVASKDMRRNERWNVRSSRDSYNRTPLWAEDLGNGQICSTAQFVWYSLSAFFGWVVLAAESGGKGLSAAEVSLAYLSDTSLIRQHLDFRKERLDGDVSTGFIKLLVDTASFLRRDTGFIRQTPLFASRLQNPIPESKWEEWCDGALSDIKHMIASLKQSIYQRRDPREPIQKILARPHPLSAIDEMLSNMSRKVRRTMHLQATFARHHLLIRLLSIVPLRARNVAGLTYRQDNTGHIRRTSAGWELYIKGREFKNFKYAAKKDFHIALPHALSAELETYLTRWRPVLMKCSTGCDTDIVFLQKNGKKFPTAHLCRLVSKLTKEYCPDTPGFGPHAFRHIVATEYLKNNPNGYQVVAYILHDKLETVLAEYRHVTTSDGFAHWTDYLEESALMSSEKDKNREK